MLLTIMLIVFKTDNFFLSDLTSPGQNGEEQKAVTDDETTASGVIPYSQFSLTSLKIKLLTNFFFQGRVTVQREEEGEKEV